MIDANFVPQFSETLCTNLINGDEDNIAAFVDARLGEVMQYTRFPCAWPSHDDKRIQFARRPEGLGRAPLYPYCGSPAGICEL